MKSDQQRFYSVGNIARRAFSIVETNDDSINTLEGLRTIKQTSKILNTCQILNFESCPNNINFQFH